MGMFSQGKIWINEKAETSLEGLYAAGDESTQSIGPAAIYGWIAGENAAKYAKGELALGQTFVAESILGTLYYGKLIEEVKVGNFKAVVPEITGRAFVTGIHHFMIDEDDPFKYGFLLE